MTFEEVVIPEGADEADRWAAAREHELRHHRMRVARMSVGEVAQEAAQALRRLNTAFAGDKSLPEIDPVRLEAYRADAVLLDERDE